MSRMDSRPTAAQSQVGNPVPTKTLGRGVNIGKRFPTYDRMPVQPSQVDNPLVTVQADQRVPRAALSFRIS